MNDLSAPAKTALRAVAAAILRHAITGAGLWLAHRGYVDQATADSATGPIAEELLGVAISLTSTGWAGARAWFSHTRYGIAWARLKASRPPEPRHERPQPFEQPSHCGRP